MSLNKNLSQNIAVTFIVSVGLSYHHYFNMPPPQIYINCGSRDGTVVPQCSPITSMTQVQFVGSPLALRVSLPPKNPTSQNSNST